MIEFINNLQFIAGIILFLCLLGTLGIIFSWVEFPIKKAKKITIIYISICLCIVIFYCLPVGDHCVGIGCDWDKMREKKYITFEDCKELCRDTSRAVVDFSPIGTCECGF